MPRNVDILEYLSMSFFLNPQNYTKAWTRITKQIFATWSSKKFGSVEYVFYLKVIVFHTTELSIY